MPPSEVLIVVIGLVCIGSFFLSPRLTFVSGFFDGLDEKGKAPGLWTLVFSQVTTWIFARSLMNAAILGYYYGIAGTLAYTAYYASFLTGWLIIDRLRYKHNVHSIQTFLADHFGKMGEQCYNFLISVRLLSEIFANLLVVGIVFTSLFPDVPHIKEGAIVAIALVGLGYSTRGGLRASLRTDVLQMMIFLVVLIITLGALFTSDGFSFQETFQAEGVSGSLPGWVLLLVAALQVFSYPLHDPVMMDRGFLADRHITKKSFFHAFWISSLCILGFGLLGIHAGLIATTGESMESVWGRLFDPIILVCLNAALIVSALSTLDSTLSSAAKLVIIDMKWAKPTLWNGRLAMAAFMIIGISFLLGDVTDLYAAVAVSGTASMFLMPVILFCVLGNARHVPLWSYLISFSTAMIGATLYYFITAKASWALELFGGVHKYTALSYICVTILVIGCTSFACGILFSRSHRSHSSLLP